MWYPFDRHLDWFSFSVILTSLHICEDFLGILRVTRCKWFLDLEILPNCPTRFLCQFVFSLIIFENNLFFPLACWFFAGRPFLHFSSLFLVMSLVYLNLCSSFSLPYSLLPFCLSTSSLLFPFLASRPCDSSHTDFSYSFSNTLFPPYLMLLFLLWVLLRKCFPHNWPY